MEPVLHAGLAIGIFMFFLLLLKKEKQGGDYLFLAWILTMLGQITFYCITIYHFNIQGILAILSFAIPLLGAPILFLYIGWLTRRNISWWRILLHLSSYPIYCGFLFLAQKSLSSSIMAENGHLKFTDASLFWSKYYAVPLAISGFVYCVWDLWLLKKHKVSIKSLFSFQEKINLKWVSYIVYSFLVLFIIASTWVFGATQFNFLPLHQAFALVGISLSLMLMAFGIYGFKQTAIFYNPEIPNFAFERLEKENQEKAAYSKSGLTQDKIISLAHQLEKVMLAEKPYLNENLNLNSLAEQLDSTPAHLSQVINQYFEESFYDYVNKYRIEKAKPMLRSERYEHLSIIGIAFECGFKSKSSFNRYFKKYTGKAPSQFQKNS